MNMRLVALLGCLAVTGAVWVWSAPPGPPAPPVVPSSGGTTRAARAETGAGASASATRRSSAARDRGVRGRTTAPRDTPPERDAPFDLDDVEARLRERRNSAPAPRSPERNPFTFGPDPSSAASGDAARGARPLAAEPAPAFVAPSVPPPPVLKLSGIAETRNGDQLVRTAIIAGQGQLFFAKIGERVGPLYEVSAIGPDIVELRETGTDRVIRLTMR